MATTDISLLTEKQRKVVESYWQLYEEKGSPPSNAKVADNAYETCGEGMVWYVKQNYPTMFEFPRPDLPEDEEEEVNLPITIMKLIHGEGVSDGNYVLSYNDDNEGRWYLRYESDDIYHSVSFTEVDRLGDDSYGIIENGSYHLTVDRLEDSAPEIAAVLDTIAKVE